MDVGEGRLEVEGGLIWYRVVGEGDRPPLLLLHGGPGYPSASLQPLEALGSDRPVVSMTSWDAVTLTGLTIRPYGPWSGLLMRWRGCSTI
jgi:pimeloyl-ACP methyl ester carboxylesterase